MNAVVPMRLRATDGEKVSTLKAKPFVKWVGGKRSIIDELTSRVPPEIASYHEVFAGGAALFFELQPQRALLTDINWYLVISYNAVKDNVIDLIERLAELEKGHNLSQFIAMRSKLAKAQDKTEIASIFIYLNKTCYNGLYRVNKKGEFNVPMGRYANPNILDRATLLAASAALKNAKIEERPFNQLRPESGCFYYLDPPYHKTYDGYSGERFGDPEHAELAELCKKINAAGGKFLLSNSNTNYVQDLYKGFVVEEVSASRNVSCKANGRGRQAELLIRNYD
jgi:DNA adenine methylase